MRKHTATILAIIILCAAGRLNAQESVLYTLYNCIDSSSVSMGSMRMEINAAKECASVFADGYAGYAGRPELADVLRLVDKGKAPQARLKAMADTSLSRFDKYRLMARLSVLGIDMVSAEDYYDKTLMCDESNGFAHILEFSEFCRINSLRNKARDLGQRALSLADTPYEEYLGRINMASVHLKLGESDKALRELALAEAIKIRKMPREMYAMMDMMRGDIYVEKDEPQMAMRHYKNALARYRKVRGRYREPLRILCEMSAIENQNGNYDEAISCLTQAMEYAQMYHTEIDRNIAVSSVYLQWGMLLKGIGKPNDARTKLQASLQTISRIVMNSRNYVADLAEIEASQASIEIDMGDYARAQALCNDAYQIYSQERFAQSPQALAGKASLLKTYGDLYKAWNSPSVAIAKYDEALYTYQVLSRAMDIAYDAERAMVLSSIGAVYESCNDIPEAISNYKAAARTLSGVVREHPKYTIHYAQVLSNIGNIYRKYGNADSSLKYMEQALSIFRAKANMNDMENAEYSKICNNLALQYMAMGKYDIAEPFFETAYQIRKYLIGKTNAYSTLWADILNNYGLYYVDTQDYDLGIYYLEQSLEIRQGLRRNIESQRMLAESYDNLGDVFAIIDSLETSEQYYQKSLNERGLLIRLSRSEYPGYVGTVQKLAAIYRKDNALYPALMLMSQLIATLEEQDAWDGKESDWKTLAEADAYHNKALILSELGKKKEARDAMLTAARNYFYGAEYVDFSYYSIAADAFCQVGNLSCDIDDYKQAENYYKTALSINKDLYTSGEMPAYTMVGTLNNLGKMYYSMQNMEEARRCYEEGKSLLENDRANEADLETIITSAIINLNIVEYYIYEKNSGIDDDEYSNCVKLLEETITTLKPLVENSGVSHYYEQAQMLLGIILN